MPEERLGKTRDTFPWVSAHVTSLSSYSVLGNAKGISMFPLVLCFFPSFRFPRLFMGCISFVFSMFSQNYPMSRNQEKIFPRFPDIFMTNHVWWQALIYSTFCPDEQGGEQRLWPWCQIDAIDYGPGTEWRILMMSLSVSSDAPASVEDTQMSCLVDPSQFTL